MTVSEIRSLMVNTNLCDAQIIASMLGVELYKYYLIENYRAGLNTKSKTEIIVEEIDGYTPSISRLEFLFNNNRDTVIDFLVEEFQERLDEYRGIERLVKDFV